MNGIPMINGKVYSWSDIVCTIAGVPVTGMSAIEYDEKRTADNVYGIGAYPVGRGSGNIEASAKITMLMDEAVAISDAAPGHRMDDIAPFDIIVSYIPEGGTKIRHDVIKNCQFKNNTRSWQQGDTSKAVEFELIVSHVYFG